MKWILENWSLIVAAGAVIAIAWIRVENYRKLTKDEQQATLEAHKDALIKAIKDMALGWVTDAEKDLGSGTGKLKLIDAYDAAVKAFPELCDIITLDQFDHLIQGPLQEMRKLLSESSEVWDYVKGA